MVNKEIINKILLTLFFPSFISGVATTNYFFLILILITIILNFKNFIKLIIIYQSYIKFFFVFYFILLISSLISDHVYHSLQSSLLYFAYILYVLSMIIIMTSDEKNPIFFLNVGILTFVLVCFDAFIEIYFGYNLFGNHSIPGRISGLFNDRWVIGSYLVRFLPILIGLFLININNFSSFQKTIIIFSFFLTSIIIIFSGERTAYLLFIIYLSLMIIYLIRKLKISHILFFSIFIILFLLLPFLFDENSDRMLNKIYFYLTNLNYHENQYLSLYKTGLNMFIKNPLLGIGPNNFRLSCSEEIYYLSEFSCSTHPHNIFIQLLAEVGILGTAMVYFVFLYFCKIMFFKIYNQKFNIYEFGLFSIISSVFINLWPLITSGNFFLSWNGFINFLPIIFYLFYKK